MHLINRELNPVGLDVVYVRRLGADVTSKPGRPPNDLYTDQTVFDVCS
jgi:hypothetical protein